MTTRIIGQSMRLKACQLCTLTVAGGAAFWVTTFAASWLSVAADYRSAFSGWSMQTVWIGSLPAGLITGYCVSHFLLRYFPRIPARGPILKSVLLSSIALVIAVILIDVPMVLHARSDSSYYFLIGFALNAVRFLLLGTVIGYLYERLNS